MERISRNALEAKGIRRIAVLSGGDSDEAEISRVSGRAVAESLLKAGFAVGEFEADRTLAETLTSFSPDVAFLATHGGGGREWNPAGIPRDDEDPLYRLRCSGLSHRHVQDAFPGPVPGKRSGRSPDLCPPDRGSL